MADRELGIFIRVTGDVTGVTTVNQALDGLAAKAGQAGATVTTVLDSAATTATSTTTPAVRTVTDALNATGGAATGAGAAASGAMNQTGAAASGAAPAVRSVTDALNASANAGTAAGAANVAALERQIRSTMAFLEALRRTNAEFGRSGGSMMAAEARAQAAAWQDLNNRVLFTAPALRQAGTATSNLAQGMNQARKSTADFGMAALNASYFVDDIQYGIRGVLNNIPLLLMSLGVSQGVTGIVSILAVALNMVVTKLDLFGTGTAKVTDKLKDLAKEAGEAADESKRIARNAEEADTVWHDHAVALEDVANKYRRLKEDIEGARQARERLNRLILEEADAQAAADLAEIEARRTEGNMSDTDAEVASRKVRAGVQQKRHDLEQGELQKRQDELKQEADAQQVELDAKTKAEKEQREATSNLLTAEARKELSDKLDDFLAQAKAERARAKALPQTIRESMTQEERLEKFGPNAPLNTQNPEVAKALANADDLFARQEEIRKRLELDSEAQSNPYAIKDAKKERERQEEFEKWKTDQERKITNTLRDADLTGKEREARARIFNANTKAEDRQSATRITSIQDREDQEREKDREAEEKRQEQEQKKAEQAQKKADTADRNVGRGIATQTSNYTRGKKGSKIQELTDRANDLKDGIDAGELEAFERALRQLANTLNARKDRDKELLSKLLRTVEAIEKQQKNSRQ